MNLLKYKKEKIRTNELTDVQEKEIWGKILFAHDIDLFYGTPVYKAIEDKTYT